MRPKIVPVNKISNEESKKEKNSNTPKASTIPGIPYPDDITLLIILKKLFLFNRIKKFIIKEVIIQMNTAINDR